MQMYMCITLAELHKAVCGRNDGLYVVSIHMQPMYLHDYCDIPTQSLSGTWLLVLPVVTVTLVICHKHESICCIQGLHAAAGATEAELQEYLIQFHNEVRLRLPKVNKTLLQSLVTKGILQAGLLHHCQSLSGVTVHSSANCTSTPTANATLVVIASSIHLGYKFAVQHDTLQHSMAQHSSAAYSAASHGTV